MTGELEVIQDTLAAHKVDIFEAGTCECGWLPDVSGSEWPRVHVQHDAHVAAEVVLALRTWREENGEASDVS